MRTTYRALYRLGITPWDTEAIPAPLAAIVEGPTALPPGVAVDLGCGTGRQAVYLAANGWTVTGVDATPQALAAARARDAAGTGETGRIQWRLADVTDPAQVNPGGRITGTATLVLDNGCLHGIAEALRPGWAATVQTLAAPGCLLLIRGVPRRRRSIGPTGLAPDELPDLLGTGWDRLLSPAPVWHCYTRR
ncbi:SAM-dependent methyltransferase [Catenulispora sp. GP43]|uniref:class I SAM-dependent methyltransferase n=1 Tax=Catenulispora sp. GP43 TaxID=3156263 RepID=UPI003516BFA1